MRNAGLAGNVELRCGDAANLPFEERSFDAIFTSFTLELFDTPEIAVVLSECSRVLRPDGRICIVAMAKKAESGRRSGSTSGRTTASRILDCRPIYVREALQDAGFHIQSATEMSMFGCRLTSSWQDCPGDSESRDLPPAAAGSSPPSSRTRCLLKPLARSQRGDHDSRAAAGYLRPVAGLWYDARRFPPPAAVFLCSLA